ncbi:MAG: GtrA family protein [Acetobacteraceae bacterium]|nr:GtrA family protein [Acetobacteraceae bacterium]
MESSILSRLRDSLVAQFLKFGVVGAVGFVFDTATVYALRHAVGLYGAGIASYFVAVTVTWGLNRVWTFRGRGHGPAHREWLRFASANSLGFLLNRGTYAALVTTVPICAEQPVLAVAAGSLAGMFVNFGLSRRLVFR